MKEVKPSPYYQLDIYWCIFHSEFESIFKPELKEMELKIREVYPHFQFLIFHLDENAYREAFQSVKSKISTSPANATKNETTVSPSTYQGRNKGPIFILHFIDRMPLRWFRGVRDIFPRGSLTISDVNLLILNQLLYQISFSPVRFKEHIKQGMSLLWTWFKSYFSYDREILALSDCVLVRSVNEKFYLERFFFYPESKVFIIPRRIRIVPVEAPINPTELILKHFSNEQLQIWGSPFIIIANCVRARTDDLIQLLALFELVTLEKPKAFLAIILEGDCPPIIYKEIIYRTLLKKVILLKSSDRQEIIEVLSLSKIFFELAPDYSKYRHFCYEAFGRGLLVGLLDQDPLRFYFSVDDEIFHLRWDDRMALSRKLIQLIDHPELYDEIKNNGKKKLQKLEEASSPLELFLSLIQKGVTYFVGPDLKKMGKMKFPLSNETTKK